MILNHDTNRIYIYYKYIFITNACIQYIEVLQRYELFLASVITTIYLVKYLINRKCMHRE